MISKRNKNYDKVQKLKKYIYGKWWHRSHKDNNYKISPLTRLILVAVERRGIRSIVRMD